MEAPQYKLASKQMRGLNAPREVGVQCDRSGDPISVQMRPPNGAWTPVRLNRKPWRIDAYWWRGVEGQVARTYYQVDPGDAPVFTIYRDDSSGVWYQQSYSSAEKAPEAQRRLLPPSKPWTSPAKR